MPRANHHRDRMPAEGAAAQSGAESAFSRVHSLSVWINGAQPLAVFVVLVRLGLR